MANSNDKESAVRLYSIGIVAENKPRNSLECEFTLREILPSLDGELRANMTNRSSVTTDSTGKTVTGNITASTSIRATWLGLAASNRKTPPDMMRGDTAYIYTISNSDKYYWVDLPSANRTLETAIYQFGANPNYANKLDNTNAYTFVISGHDGQISFTTTQANGEADTYAFQIDTKAGTMLLTDGSGNTLGIDSKSKLAYVKNSMDSCIVLDGKKATLKADEIEISASSKLTLKSAFIYLKGLIRASKS